jgi:hypothetical protein
VATDGLKGIDYRVDRGQREQKGKSEVATDGLRGIDYRVDRGEREQKG